MKLYYIEDCNGGFICYSKDKDYFLRDKDRVICYEGDKLELEKYLNRHIDEQMIVTATLSTSDAFAMLEIGKRVRRKAWKQGHYIKLNKIGRIFHRGNKPCPIQFTRLYYDWEIVE